MIFAAGILVVAGMIDDGMPGAPTGGQMTAYVVGFIVLFVLSGIGNGSTYKMIPSIFEAKAADKDGWSPEQKAAWSRRMSGALIGFAGAVGALGGVFINIALRAVLHRRGEVRDQRLLGVPGLLRDLRRRHLGRVPAHAVGGGGDG